MTEAEAKDLSIDQEERRNYMRMDGAKANYSKKADKVWLVMREAWLNNGPGGTPGDSVGVLELWDGATEEAAADREEAALTLKKSNLLHRFKEMVTDDARVLYVGRGTHNMAIPLPEGCKQLNLRHDLLAKVKWGNTNEDLARRWLMDNFEHDKHPGSTKDTYAVLFHRRPFALGGSRPEVAR